MIILQTLVSIVYYLYCVLIMITYRLRVSTTSSRFLVFIR